MGKIGFKTSWMNKDENKPKSSHKSPKQTNTNSETLPGTAVDHITNIIVKIQEYSDYIASAKFSKAPKQNKQAIIESYTFLVKTLVCIQTPNQNTNPGINQITDNLVEIE